MDLPRNESGMRVIGDGSSTRVAFKDKLESGLWDWDDAKVLAPTNDVGFDDYDVAAAVFELPEPTSQLGQALSELLGRGKVSDSADSREFHSRDKWYAEAMPDVVVFAESTADVSRLMSFAHKNRIPVYTRGAGHGYVGGCVPVRGGIALSLIRMKGMRLAPQDGVAIVQPGVITGDLQKAAREIGWDYPPDPASLKESSIGGNIATNAGGPRCLKYGVTKNYVLGLEVVLATGEVMRCGGRVHKNKTGFDLVGLMTGSEGMLGVVTEAVLRLIPKPQSRAMLAAVFPTFTQAAAAVQGVFAAGCLPSAMEITDSFTLSAARKRLGADVLPEGEAHLMLETDGATGAVRVEMAELKNLLQSMGATYVQAAMDEESCEQLWNIRREFSYSLRDTGLTKLNEDIVVPRSKLVELVRFAGLLQRETGMAIACFGHAGDGNIHTNIMVDGYEKSEVRQRADDALHILFTWVLENGGAVTGEHGIGLAKKPWVRQALGEVAFQAQRAIKRALDPHNILNPGKWLDL